MDNSLEAVDRQIPEEQNYEQIFREKYSREQARSPIKRPNVLICGYTGSGKTSLIRAVCGDVVPFEKIGSGAPKTMGYDCYENEFICLWDSKGLELGDTEETFTERTRDFIRERQNNPELDRHIHLVWYTIQGSGARITECDLNLIGNIFNPKNVIVVLTKKDITRPPQLEAMRRRLIDAGVPREQIIACSDEEAGAEGCAELIRKSLDMLPDAYRDAFVEAQKLDKQMKIEYVYAKNVRAKTIIATGTSAAAAIGITPIPVADSTMLIPTQVAMIASLAALYGLKDSAVKKAALPFVARVVGMFAATSLLKLFPGLGSGINTVVAASLTGAMGVYVQNSFEKIAIAKIKGEPIPERVFDSTAFKMYFDALKDKQEK